MADIDILVQFIYGENDIIIPAKQGFFFNENIGYYLKIIENASHSPFYGEAVPKLFSAIDEFLQINSNEKKLSLKNNIRSYFNKMSSFPVYGYFDPFLTRKVNKDFYEKFTIKF